MPRVLDPALREGLERANPVVTDIIEVTAPDATKILRRANDQFFTTPPLVSQTPAATAAADPRGALMLAPSNLQIASFYTENATRQFGATVNPGRIIQGVGWTIDPAYGRVVVKKFTARVKRNGTTPLDLQLHIYRPKIQRLFRRHPVTGAIEELGEVTFVDLLPDPVIVRYASLAWVGDHADVVFDLSAVRPELAPGPMMASDPVIGNPIAANPHYIFEIDPVNPPKGGILEWKMDNTTASDVPGIGFFQDITWLRSDRELGGWHWGISAPVNTSPCFKLEVETYPATSQLVYAVDMPAVPAPASTGRVVFERSVPPGTGAVLELSTAGAAGPWTVVKHGDAVATKQLQYHLRLTLNASASLRQTPRVAAFGLDFRIPVDVTAEGSIEPVSHEIQVPFCEAGIGEGRVTIVRHGLRDYRDVAADLAVSSPTSKLEVDHYLGSRHPRITRDRWFHLERAPVANRDAIEAAETLTLLSPLKAIKKKIPAKIETINTVHTVVAGTTASQVLVTPALQGVAGSGDYLGKGYYLRVRTSTQVGVGSGVIQTIDNNTNTDRLDFTTALPGVLAAGDVVEVHSAQYAQPVLQWTDADPADVWWELLTTHLSIPAEKLGFAGVGQASRSGLPPRVTDRAPGDAATQAKLKVTLRVQEEQDGDRLIDEISFIMGGCTVAIGGQFVFRQIYSLRDANDQITVPTAPPEKVFDARDYAGLQTPTGVEGRVTSMSCDYGVNTTLVSDDTQSASTAQFIDADALAYLQPQDVEGLGHSSVPSRIARWLFNAADAGLLLATQLNKQVVRVASTGLRVWSWTTVDQHPELHVGDSVWLITDQYTDYDPTRKMQIRGPWAFRAIIVSAQAGGRRFRALIPGLAGAVPVRGGTGTRTPDPAQGDAPTASITRSLAAPRHEILQFSGIAGGAGPLQWRYKSDGVYAFGGAWQTSALPQIAQVNKRPLADVEVILETKQADGQVTISAPYRVTAMHEGGMGSTAWRVDTDLLRSGLGGVPVRRGRIPVDPVYSDDGVTPLVDPVLRRVTTSLFGPSGAHPMDVVETGGGRGYGGFTTLTGDLVTTARDSRAALLNNHFRYATDGAAGVVESATQSFTHTSYLDGSRRPTTLRNPTLVRDVPGNDIDVGQERSRGGFTNVTGGLVATAADSRAALLANHFRYGTDGPGGVVESGTQAFVHPTYTDASRRPVTLRDPTLVADVGANDINVGQSRARGGFTNATGGLVSTAADSRAALLNNHFRYATDTAAGVVETAARSFVHLSYVDGSRRPITLWNPTLTRDVIADDIDVAQVRARTALNGSNRLVTGVDAAATGADGYTNILGRFGVVLRASAQAGAGRAIVQDGVVRRGDGGVDVRSAFIPATPVYRSDGTAALLDTVLGRITDDLKDSQGRTIRAVVNVDTNGKVPVESLATAPAIAITATADTGAGTLDVSWSVSGMPTGTVYDVAYSIDGGSMDSQNAVSGSSHTFTSVTFNGAPGKGAVTVFAKYNGLTIATAVKNKTFTT